MSESMELFQVRGRNGRPLRYQFARDDGEQTFWLNLPLWVALFGDRPGPNVAREELVVSRHGFGMSATRRFYRMGEGDLLALLEHHGLSYQIVEMLTRHFPDGDISKPEPPPAQAPEPEPPAKALRQKTRRTLRRERAGA